MNLRNEVSHYTDGEIVSLFETEATFNEVRFIKETISDYIVARRRWHCMGVVGDDLTTVGGIYATMIVRHVRIYRNDDPVTVQVIDFGTVRGVLIK